MKKNIRFHYLYTDHLGTPILGVSNHGTVTWKAMAEAFGAAGVLSKNLVEINLRFPGQYFDRESEISYNYYRYYNQNNGRYIQEDLIGVEGGLNLYSYALSNSIKFFDQFGLKAQVCCREILSIFGVKAHHCFVNEKKDEPRPACDNCNSESRTLGLQGPPPIGTSKNGNGQKIIDDRFNNPSESICGPWVERCDLNKCLTNEFDSYTDPSRYAGLGPNSNTFAYTLASRCGIPSPPDRPWSPGWGQDPAGPPIGNMKDLYGA